jgi:hypothetical protein
LAGASTGVRFIDASSKWIQQANVSIEAGSQSTGSLTLSLSLSFLLLLNVELGLTRLLLLHASTSTSTGIEFSNGGTWRQFSRTLLTTNATTATGTSHIT